MLAGPSSLGLLAIFGVVLFYLGCNCGVCLSETIVLVERGSAFLDIVDKLPLDLSVNVQVEGRKVHKSHQEEARFLG